MVVYVLKSTPAFVLCTNGTVQKIFQVEKFILGGVKKHFPTLYVGNPMIVHVIIFAAGSENHKLFLLLLIRCEVADAILETF